MVFGISLSTWTENETWHGFLYFNGESEGFQVEVALQYNDGYSDNIFVLRQHHPTPEWRVRQDWRQPLPRLWTTCKKDRSSQGKRQNLERIDWEGFCLLFFRSWCQKLICSLKDKPKTSRKSTCSTSRWQFVADKLTFFLMEKWGVSFQSDPQDIKARDAREAARKARDESRNGKIKKDKGLLSGKLTPAQSKNPAKNELYLVEGDSAVDLPSKVETASFRYILPLRRFSTEGQYEWHPPKRGNQHHMIYTIGAGLVLTLRSKACFW